MVMSLKVKHVSLTLTLTVTKHSYILCCNPQKSVTFDLIFVKITLDSCGYRHGVSNSLQQRRGWELRLDVWEHDTWPHCVRIDIGSSEIQFYVCLDTVKRHLERSHC